MSYEHDAEMQIMWFSERRQLRYRNGHPPCRTGEPFQTARLALSGAASLLRLWYGAIGCNLQKVAAPLLSELTTVEEKERCGLEDTCRRGL